jgi:hypothetical protein
LRIEDNTITRRASEATPVRGKVVPLNDSGAMSTPSDRFWASPGKTFSGRISNLLPRPLRKNSTQTEH